MKCNWRNCEKPARDHPYRGHETLYCSKQCKNKAAVDFHRKRTKNKIVNKLGGKCVDCEYSKCHRALHVHHLDPSKKDLNVSHTTKWSIIEPELDKCVLLCSNCHAERHCTWCHSDH